MEIRMEVGKIPKYTKLTKSERVLIARWKNKGVSNKRIAKLLGRSCSIIAEKLIGICFKVYMNLCMLKIWLRKEKFWLWVQHDPYKEEKEILFLADKLEIANWNRAENALKTMPKWIVNRYKEEWIKRIPDIEKKVLEFRDKYPKFLDEFEKRLKYSREKIKTLK